MDTVVNSCVFKPSEVRRCVEHAFASKKWSMGYETSTLEPQPGLLFVHDQGVYLMSNGDPRDTDGDKAYVAYAEGCDPDKDENWWENSRALVGGDDFVEVLPIYPSIYGDLDAYNELVIDVSPSELALGFRSLK